MLATMLWFVILDSTAKYLMQSYPVVQVIWARFFFHIIFVLILMAPQVAKEIKSQSLKYQILRSIFMFVTTALFFIGISTLPLTTGSTIMFMTPIILTILSIPMLGEKVGLRRWLGIATGFAGALVVIRPTGENLQLSVLVILLAAVTHALYQVFTRKLGSRDKPVTSLFYTGVVGAVVTSVVAPFYWQPVANLDWLLFIFAGIAGGIGHLCMIRAFRSAPASVVAPFSYSSLLWATLSGFVLFGNLPDGSTLAGASMIIGSGLYIFYREQAAKQKINSIVPYSKI
ncbi:MAG: drug/metabolite transporter (DMT)-like permease [Gammaproteobacteria bacterium]|jgi:drug/metabolite transporter (DMT)-like permease